MNEIWADISGYEGKYQVSNLGRVKSLNYNHTDKEQILKPGDRGRHYLKVSLYSNGKCKNFYLHRLVAQTFIPNPNNLPIINHKDENPMNNCVTNLEWCNNRYNNCYGTRLERAAKSCYKKVGCYKDNKIIKVYKSIIDTENDGFKSSAVCSCCKGKYKTHHGFQFKYLED